MIVTMLGVTWKIRSWKTGKVPFRMQLVYKSQAYDALRKELLTKQEILTWLDSCAYIIEESLSQPTEIIPFDFKVYFQNKKAKVCVVINRNTERPTLTFYDAEKTKIIPWCDIFSDRPDKQWFEGKQIASNHFNEKRVKNAVSVANNIIHNNISAEHLFVSLDLYSMSDGRVFLGEITPRPGAMHMFWLKKTYCEFLFETKKPNHENNKS